ncbi:polysaccharide deacetylase family protein [Sphingomonas qomolangmaensis]|uniref:Chitooligosaccharide deacetylase n=1 Tax=Sphingomonas qomolangmaensis TaxID=2918765 RepID=A0ABY5LDM5_9SPHN|nr:polysaccharide deacetylase family protein [Sphingomonas qomolangmaensis]UUL82816.1 polysaccharide deacetylase family protein [Sphingomonas qomolangmaensis]
MTTRVFLTVDTELMWRHHAAGLPVAEQIARSIEPAGVGVGYQLRMLAEHGLKATFFVDPMPARTYGLDVVKAIVAPILAAGQEVQLHLHPNWAGAVAGDGGTAHARFELVDYTLAEQRDLIAEAAALLVAAGVPQPVAFRSGSYAANDDTLAALAELGFGYDSSHNGSEHPWPSAITLPVRQIAPVRHRDVIECPVTLIEDAPGKLRHFQICALSVAEMRAALDHAAREDHAAVTIVSHGFELAARTGTRANRVHMRRFEALCAMLAARAEAMPTTWYAEAGGLRLGQGDAPLGPNVVRTRLRQAEQLWSNMVEERAA